MNLGEIASSESFKRFQCSFSSREEMQSIGMLDHIKIINSAFRPNTHFLQPTPEYVSHFVWGGTFALSSNLVGGIRVEDCIDELFGVISQPVYLTTLGDENSFAICANNFKMQLAVEFLWWADRTQEVLIVDQCGNSVIYLNDGDEYMVAIRNPDEIRNPFPRITDTDLILAFRNDLQGQDIRMWERTLQEHLAKEVLPTCLQSATWTSYRRNL